MYLQLSHQSTIKMKVAPTSIETTKMLEERLAKLEEAINQIKLKQDSEGKNMKNSSNNEGIRQIKKKQNSEKNKEESKVDLPAPIKYKNLPLNQLVSTIQIRQEQKALPIQTTAARKVKANVMRLQGKSHCIDSNIFNVTVCEIMRKQAYLSFLRNEADRLKRRLNGMERSLQQKQQQKIQRKEQQSIQLKKSIKKERSEWERRSLCGRIIKRDAQGESTSGGKTHFLQFTQTKPDSSKYVWNPKIEQKSERAALLSLNPQDRPARPATTHRIKNLRVLKQQKQEIDANDSGQEYKIQITPTPQTKNPNQNKIKNMRADILSILNIPAGFPLESPSSSSTMEDNAMLVKHTLSLFGIEMKLQTIVASLRKYMNCLELTISKQMNLVWYYEGAFYLGGWETSLTNQGLKHGQGFQYLPNKSIYRGQFKDGKKQGKGALKMIAKQKQNQSILQLESFISNNDSLFTIDNCLMSEGEWVNSKLNGWARQIEENGDQYEGMWIDGRKSGKGQLLTHDGQFYEGQIKDDVKQGFGKQKLKNGDEFEGQYHQNKFNGTGTYKWINGNTYHGLFQNGKREGFGEWRSSEGDVYQGSYHDDHKEGEGEYIWKNGQKYKGQFKNDQMNGVGYYCYPSGKIGKFEFKDGKMVKRLYSKQQEEYRAKRKSNKANTFSVEQI